MIGWFDQTSTILAILSLLKGTHLLRLVFLKVGFHEFERDCTKSQGKGAFFDLGKILGMDYKMANERDKIY
jgi:hypothetical protein